MKEFSWPVVVLAAIFLVAGAVVGDALRSAMGGGRTADAGVYDVVTSGR